MKHIEFYAEKQGNQRKQAIYLAGLLAGIYGILQYIQKLPGVVYSEWVVCLSAVLSCGMLWSVYFYLHKIYVLCLAVIVLAGASAGFILRDKLKIQILHMCGCILGVPNQEAPVSVTETVLLLALLLSVFFFVMEIILKNHQILYLLTLALLLLSPAVGMQAGIRNVMSVGFFQILFLAAHVSDKSGNRKLRVKIRTEKKTVRSMVGFLAAAFLIAVPWAAHSEQTLYGIVDQAEGTVYRLAQQLSGRADAPEASGWVSGGNHYRTGTAQLELRVTRQPSENLYLKGFEGGVYTGGRWERADDDTLFANMQKTLNWERWGSMIGSMYSSMYFAVNNMMPQKGRKEPSMLTVRHLDGAYGNLYAPYYSQNRRGQDDDDRDSSDGYDYFYYEQKDLKIDWDNVAYRYGRVRDWYRQVRDAYRKEIQTAYIQVPDQLLPRLSALAAENPQEDLEEITAFILFTLQSRAFYTLTPGRAPVSEDIVEYFLFERGCGYCVHFAAAATLLYRLYGVPARYVSGYRVLPSDFVRQEDGTYLAMVTDVSAHAWTEIFLEDYGWTPVEVTPSVDGVFTVSYPGFDSSVLPQIWEKRSLEGTIKDLRISGSESGNHTAKGTEISDRWKHLTEMIRKNENISWFFTGLVSCLLLLLPVFLDYHRLRQLKLLESAGCRKVYARFIQMLHFAGYLADFDGSEEDFAAEAAAAIPMASVRDIRHMQDIIREAAFGPHAPDPEKEEFVKRLYFQLAEQVYGTLNRHQKWLFRYLKTFG